MPVERCSKCGRVLPINMLCENGCLATGKRGKVKKSERGMPKNKKGK